MKKLWPRKDYTNMVGILVWYRQVFKMPPYALKVRISRQDYLSLRECVQSNRFSAVLPMAAIILL